MFYFYAQNDRLDGCLNKIELGSKVDSKIASGVRTRFHPANPSLLNTVFILEIFDVNRSTQRLQLSLRCGTTAEVDWSSGYAADDETAI